MSKLGPSDMPRLREDLRKLIEIKGRERIGESDTYFQIAALSIIPLIGVTFSLGDSPFDPFIVLDFHLWAAAIILSWIVICLAMGIFYKVRLKRDARLRREIHESWGQQGISFGEGLHGDGIVVFRRVTDGYVRIDPNG